MKKAKLILCVSIVLVLSLAALAGCGKKNEDLSDNAFSSSEGIAENGFWEDIRALDYVEIFNYQSMQIPNDIHQISDDTVQYEIDNLMAEYSSEIQITDRTVADGDIVNIDYVGSVDGVDFDGGSTGGMGTNVTAGSTEYIDDFLTQIIGHMPGETINVEVTFPEDYGADNLNGKDAVFITTINYIVEYNYPELNDEFVVENLSASYDWKTVEEMRENIRSQIQTNSIQQYIRQYFTTEVTIKSVPDKLIQYQEQNMLNYYQEYADSYEMELEEFFLTYMGVSSVDDFVLANQEANLTEAKYGFVVQAIAEDAGMSVSDEDLTNYFIQYTGEGDYSIYEEQYGLAYLKQVVLYQKVLDFVVENAVLT